MKWIQEKFVSCDKTSTIIFHRPLQNLDEIDEISVKNSREVCNFQRNEVAKTFKNWIK